MNTDSGRRPPLAAVQPGGRGRGGGGQQRPLPPPRCLLPGAGQQPGDAVSGRGHAGAGYFPRGAAGGWKCVPAAPLLDGPISGYFPGRVHMLKLCLTKVLFFQRTVFLLIPGISNETYTV